MANWHSLTGLTIHGGVVFRDVFSLQDAQVAAVARGHVPQLSIVEPGHASSRPPTPRPTS
eukprot:scaffold674_cov119-Isochrysis_galbana.AAC.3